ncbi:hypothetical protein AGMMS50229_03480 [Campylobacterota bacterium]|nr:hypothetical protein AGMMS50229_03480 [Campylobacterota bacterium]
MSIETLKRFSPIESDFVLGKEFVALAAKTLGLTSKELADELARHIILTQSDQELSNCYDFLIELMSLTYLLHKWGLLLFHLDSGLFGDWILAIEVDGELCIICEQDDAITLKTIDGAKTVVQFSHTRKSGLCQLLLWLNPKYTALEVIQIEDESAVYDGNFVSFNRARAAAQKAQIDLMKQDFLSYKERLGQLQQLFIDGFGKPNGMV